MEAGEFEEQVDGKAKAAEPEERPEPMEIASEAAEIVADMDRIETEITSPEPGELEEIVLEEAPISEPAEEAKPAKAVESIPPPAEMKVADTGEEEAVEETPESPAEEAGGEKLKDDEPVGEDGSLESILADMKKKGKNT